MDVNIKEIQSENIMNLFMCPFYSIMSDLFYFETC